MKKIPSVCACLLGVSCGQLSVASGNVLPNVLLIIADDCSYYDIGCFGAVNNQTPNIDKLAEEGLKFNNAFNSVSMSVPTRHCMYTGMYPIKHGGYPNHSSVKPGTKSMPHFLKEYGYRVGLSGKYHVSPASCFPFERVPGFQENCVAKDVSYTLDGVTEFIGRNPKEPFCLVLGSVNPHAPWTAGDPSRYDLSQLKLPPNWVDTKETRQAYANYLAEVSVLDQEVGDIVRVLKEQKQFDKTLIIFVSEQGSQFAGAKWTLWTPGTKSAMIASWKGKIKPGSQTQAIVQYEDILPTIIDIAGGKIPSHMDGKSIQNVLYGKTDKHRDYAFGVHANIPEGPAYPIRSVNDGTYKLIWNLLPDSTYTEKHIEKAPWYLSWKKKDTDQARFIMKRYKHRPEFELYNIREDIFELNNLADDPQYASKISSMKTVLQKWMKSQGDKGISTDKPRKKKAAEEE